MCQSKDPARIEETYEIALKRARDQDVVYFLSGFASNDITKRQVTHFFQDHYEEVGRSARMARINRFTFHLLALQAL